MKQVRTFVFTSLLLQCAILVAPTAVAQNYLDLINLGDDSSEGEHGFRADLSESFQGTLNTPARRLLPPKKENWVGGAMTFKMRVDPKQQNYFTAKFWGSEVSEQETRLMLFADDLQIGQRHLGDVDPLDILANSPRYPDRFFYKTLPLPIHVTKGKREVSLSIRVEGSVWGYGKSFDRYQSMVKQPSRGIYRCYTHTDSFLTVDKSEAKGSLRRYPLRTGPGPEVLDTAMKRVNKHLGGLIKGDNNDLGQDNVILLTRGCFVPWTVAYHNRQALNKIVRAIDHEYLKFTEDDEIFRAEWHGAGPLGDAISLLGKSLDRYLDHTIEGTNVERRTAWTRMLLASRDWHISNRRAYSNQAMTVDFNLYRCNRGIAVLNPKQAWPEKNAIQLLHEAAGIIPWKGSYSAEMGRPEWPFGKNFKQTTEQGLSRELGYVGSYGELVNPIIRDMYASSRPRPGAEGDPLLKERLIKVAKARSMFRYPVPDRDGFRAMRMETVIGWRDWHYPGEVTYDQMPCDDGGPGDTAATTMDPELIGFSRQMLDENQYFAAIEEQNKRRGVNVMKALMRAPENYQKIKNYRGSLKPLPTTAGSPDFVFADTDVGVVALKHGDDILFTSLYWRARYGINNLARVHFMTPTFERDATVVINTRFDGSGARHQIRNRTNMAFTKRYEDEYQKQGPKFSMADQIYPIATIPSFIKDFRAGDENLYAGKGKQYLMVFGQYCIAMNCDSRKRFTFEVPTEFVGAKVLSGETTTAPSAKYRMSPNETLVLYRE